MRIEEQVVAWLARQDVAVYLVGGCVRDRLLERAVYDLDLAVAGGGLVLARRLADRFGGAYYPLDEARGTGRAVLPASEGGPLVVDAAQFRGSDLATDLADRDFTINALAADVRTPGDIIDQHDGLADLAAGLIRPISDGSIRNDPLRALRAVRLAAGMGFALAPETEALIRRDGAGLAYVSGERTRDELARLLAIPRAAPYLCQLDDLGLLTVILPELEPLRALTQPLPHYLDALTHSLETVRALEEILQELYSGGNEQPGIRRPQGMGYRAGVDALVPFADRLREHLNKRLGEARARLVTLKLAALLHDTGKPGARTVDSEGQLRFIGHEKDAASITASVLQRLRFNNTEVRLGETIVHNHMRPLSLANEESVSCRAVYRFFRDAGEAGVEVLLHALADHRATYAPGIKDDRWPRLLTLVARMLADYWERGPERVAPPPLIDGNELLDEFRLQPGPQIGALLEAVREAQVAGEVSTRSEALALVRANLAGHK